MDGNCINGVTKNSARLAPPLVDGDGRLRVGKRRSAFAADLPRSGLAAFGQFLSCLGPV